MSVKDTKTCSTNLDKKNSSRLKSYFKRNWPLYVMILPMVIYLLIFSYYPMLGLQLAFKEWKPKLGIWGSPWATDENGELDLLFNFKTLFTDDNFFNTFKNTLRISLLRIIVGFQKFIRLYLQMSIKLSSFLLTNC